MNKFYSLIVGAVVFLCTCYPAFGQSATISGELKANHKVTLTWNGPNLSESKATFTDYRLDVTVVSPSGKNFVVPGYFAADGNAAESSSNTGNKWRIHFLPLETGTYTYSASFKTGTNIATLPNPGAGSGLSFDGDSGSFSVSASDKSGIDFRAKGKLEYVGEHFLKWTSGEYFYKSGANSPEVFLEYSEFDNTPSNTKRNFPPRTYGPHINDWVSGDPTWQGQKGKGIIGAVNYLSSVGVNAHYFLTMSVYGDNDTVYPWITIDDNYIYDVSKLDQWQIVFDHMMAKGVMVHFVLTEGENQNLFEFTDGGGSFADNRKIYYREMVSRFGYLNAITWNIGEENGWNRNENYGKANTDAQRIAFADFIRELTFYNDHITVENGPTSSDAIFPPLIGQNDYTGASIQGRFNTFSQGRPRILRYVGESSAAGKKWVVTYDEPYTGGTVAPDDQVFREGVIWATLTAGGAGTEFYVGGGQDFNLEDYRPHEFFWNQQRIAREFLELNNLPYQQMVNRDDLVTNGWCLAKEFDTYIVYLPDGGTTNINITGEYSVKWLDPRSGVLVQGSVTQVSTGESVSLGSAPYQLGEDWVILLQNNQSGPIAVTGVNITQSDLTIAAGNSYQLSAQVLPPNADDTSVSWSSSNNSVASVSASGAVTGLTEGTAVITATSNEGGFTDTITVQVVSSTSLCVASGTIKMERYNGISGTSLNDLFSAANYPNNPSSTTELSLFEIPVNSGDNYGSRVSGYLCAPETGDYYFWISGDDNSELRISDGTNPANATTIATVPGWSSSREWNKYGEQKSAAVFLEVGKAYYIEAFMKEGGGGDNLAVGWRKPSQGNGGSPLEVIPGSVLAPDLESTVPSLIPVTGVSLSPSTANIGVGESVSLTALVNPVNATNSTVTWISSDTGVATVSSFGEVTGVSGGTVSIQVVTSDGGLTDTATIIVSDDPIGPPPIDAPVNFAQSTVEFNGLTDISAGTSLMFGPDGRLYVAEYQGQIKIYTLVRLDNGTYQATDIEILNDIQSIQDYNDDGTPFTSSNRETTGLTVAGTAANPVLYVTSSDFRIGGGGGGGNGDIGLDTNSGIVTRFTWNGTSWDVVDLIRGLPRSEENHATNGLEYTLINGNPYLIIAQGGHTNGGSPSKNFAYTTEYALSAAILSVDLNAINSLPIKNDNGRAYIYDLPTLDDPTRANVNGIDDPNAAGYDGIDVNDPFGGNDGLNQAIWDPTGPVQVYSAGYRNAYDLVVTESGGLYVTDNGANGGWGGFPEGEGNALNVTNNYLSNEPGSSSPSGGEQINNEDHLIKVTTNIQGYTPGSFYGGHPNPVRANPAGAGLFVAPATSGLGGAQFLTQTYDPDGSTPGSTTDPNAALPANWPPIPLNLANPAEADWRGPGEDNPDGPEASLVTIWGTNTNGIDEYTASNFNGAMKGDLIAGVNNGVLRRVQLDDNGDLAKLTSTFASGIGGNALGITCNSDTDPFPGTIWAVTLNGKLVVLEPQDFDACPVPSDPSFDPLADYDGDGYTNQDEVDNGTDYCNGGSQPNDFDKVAGGELISDLNDEDDDNDGIPDAQDPFQIGQPDVTGTDAFNLPVENELLSDNPLYQGYQGLGFTGLMNNGESGANWLNWLDRRDSDFDPNPNDILGGAIGAMTMQMTSGTAVGNINSQEKGFQYGVRTASNTGQFIVQGSLVNFNDPLQLYGSEAPADGELGIFIGDGSQSNFIRFVITPSGLLAQQEINDVPQTPLTVSLSEAQRPQSGVMLYYVIDAATGAVQLEYSFDGGNRQVLGSLNAQGAILQAIQDFNTDLAVGLIGTSNDNDKELEGTWDLLNVYPASGLAPFDEAVVRINAAGETVLSTDGQVNWENNANIGAQNTLSYSVNTGDVFAGGLLYENRHSSIPDYIDEATYNALFAEERYDLPEGQEMSYSIPVRNGAYQVNIYMGNSFSGTSTPGKRVFDIQIEGSPVHQDVDLAVLFGHLSGGMLSSPITVSDGILDITFLHVVENPLLNAIELVRIEPDEFPIAVVPIPEQLNDAGATINLPIQASGGKNDENFAFLAEGLPLGLTLDQATGVISGVIDSNAFTGGENGDGLYPVTVSVSKPSSFVQILHFNWKVSGPLTVTNIDDQKTIAGGLANIQVDAFGGNTDVPLVFSMEGAPAGITIDPDFGLISGTIDPLAFNGGPQGDGVYSVVVTVSRAGSADAEISFTWEVTDFPVILYRVNAGGQSIAATDAAVNWEANAAEGAFDGDNYSVNTGVITQSSLTFANRDASVPFYVDQTTFEQLFGQERYDEPEGEEMVFSFPVTNGEYDVHIYLGNSFSGTQAVGSRVFGIQMEGQQVETGLDPIVAFGHKVAGMKSYTVQVNDGVLDIEFTHITENPLVNGIEVVSTAGDLFPISVQPIADQINSTSDNINLAVSASGGDSNQNFTYSITGAPDGVEIEPTNGLIYGQVTANAFLGGPSANGIHEVTVKVFKAGSFPQQQSFVWTVVGPLQFTDLVDQQNVNGAAVSFPVQAVGGDINEAASYSMEGAPEGLVIDPATGIISGQLSPTASQGGPASDGNYVVTITAVKAGSNPAVQSFGWKVTEQPFVVFRINAGGGVVSSTDDGPDWNPNLTEGTEIGNGFTVNTGEIVNSGLLFASRHPSIPDYIDEPTFSKLFAEERYDEPEGDEMTYSIPLVNGTYQVNLYIGNAFSGTATAGSRTFTVQMEGEDRISQLDLIEQFGHLSAGMLSREVIVADGQLDITFIHEIENPLVNAIEITTLDPVLIPLRLESIADQRTEPETVVNTDLVLATGGDPALDYEFSATGLPEGLTIDPSTGQISGTVSANALNGGVNQDGVHTVIVFVDKTGYDQASVSFTWTIGELTWLNLDEDLSYTPRHECSFVQAGEHFFLMGGRENPKTIDVYDYTNNVWRSIPDSPPAEFNHFQATEYQGMIWIIGAFQNNDFPNEIPAEYVWIFDPSNDKWYRGPEIPIERRRGSAGVVVHNDKFYIVGGNTIGHNGGYVNWFDQYDPATGEWTVLPDAPRSRDHFHAAMVDGKLYAAGGRLSGGEGGTFGPTIAEVDVFNFQTNSWETLAESLPTPRGASTSANYNNTLLVIGGEVNGENVYGQTTFDALKITEQYDPVMGVWNRLPDMNHDRHGTQAIVSGEGVYILAGSDNLGGGFQQNMEYFGNNKPEGEALAASSLTAPEEVQFVAGENKTIELVAEGGNMGIYVESIAIIGGSGFTLNEAFTEYQFISPSSTKSLSVSLDAQQASAQAVLVVTYNGGLQKNIVLTTGGSIVGLFNPGDQYNQEGEQVQLPLITTTPGTNGSYSVTNLPPGLSLNASTGLISGTVTSDNVPGRFIEKNGLLMVEAEQGTLSGTWSTFTNNEGDVVLQSGTNHFNDLNGGQINYDIRIETPGVYRFVWRNAFTGNDTGNKNDSWLKFDNNQDVWFFGYVGDDLSEAELEEKVQNDLSEIVFPKGSSRVTPETTPAGSGTGGFFKTYRSFGSPGGLSWQAKVNDEDPYQVYVWFEKAGDYSFQIAERSAGHQIDKMLLYKVDLYDLIQDVFDAVPESQITGGTGGAADGSPYAIEASYSSDLGSENVNFNWVIGEPGDQDPGPGGCIQEVTLSFDDFETGYGSWIDGGSDANRVNNTNFSTSGNFTVGLQDNTNTSVITSPTYDLSQYGEVNVSFNYFVVSFDNENEDFWFQVSTDGGASFTTVEEWNLGDEFQNNSPSTGEVKLQGPFSATTVFRFRADASGNADDVYLDDILITACQTAKAVEQIVLDPALLVLEEGDSGLISATVLPADATNKTVVYSSSNTAVATVDNAGNVQALVPGEVTITAENPASGVSASATVTVLEENNGNCQANGKILYERWEGIPDWPLENLFNSPNYPNNPTFTSELTQFQAPTNVAESYGARISGYLCPPESGVYFFWISGDDYSRLNISTDQNPANVQTIAGFEGWTSPLEWNKYGTQKSAGIVLQAGNTYYIEAFVKEGGGGDHLAVGWRKPSEGDGGTPTEIIPGSVLSSEVFQQPECNFAGGPPVASVVVNDETCAGGDGSFVFSFSDNANRTNIEFSLDGGVTYPLNVSDNTGSATFSNLSPGDYELWVRWGNDQCPQFLGTYTIDTDCSGCTASGSLFMERYNNVPGVSLAELFAAPNFPSSPDQVVELNAFEIPTNVADNYGVRVRAFLCAPETGTYYFWVSGDDNSQLNLSPSEDPNGAAEIANVPGWTPSRVWDKYGSQKSTAINLVQGQTYYIEAFMNEAGGGDNLAVGWRKPSDGDGSAPTEIIPGSVLSPATGQQECNWTFAANEGQQVNFTGTRTVRYGANGVFVEGTFTNGVACNNATFGDPLVGVVKYCEICEDGAVDVTGVTVSPASASMLVGEELQLTAEVSPADATNTQVTWSSTDLSVAQVDGDGLVTAIGPGTATITATTFDGDFKDSSAITVTEENTGCPNIGISQGAIISFAGTQDQGAANVIENGNGIYVENNGWKAILYSYNITPQTILEFEFQSTIEGEQHAIGLTQGNSINQPHAFTLYGIQSIGNDIEAYNNYSGGGYKQYSIPVGQFYTGTVDRIFFTADHDNGAKNGNSFFRNIKVYEAGTCGETVSQLPWIENFNTLSNGSTQDTGETAWTVTTQGGSTMSVEFDELVVRSNDLGGSAQAAIWESQTINISGESGVSIQVGINDIGGNKENEDFIRVYYQLDGGAPVQFGAVVNDISAQTFTVNGLSGSSLKVFVEAQVSWTNEAYVIESVEVKAGQAAAAAKASIAYSEIKLYPNPATEYAILKLITNEDRQLERVAVYDVLGRQVSRFENNTFDQEGSRVIIPVDRLQPGVYQVVIQMKNGESIAKRLLVSRD